MWDIVRDWRETACEHDNGCLAGEWIGNIMGIARFRSIAAGLAKERFGNLVDFIGGLSGLMDDFVPVEVVRQVLPELQTLMGERSIGATRIICSGDGASVNGHVDRGPFDYRRFRSLDALTVGGGPPWPDLVELGVQGDDLVVRSRGDDSRELLRARILEQTWDPSAEESTSADDDPSSQVTFRNAETGESIRVRSYGFCQKVYPPSIEDDCGILRVYPTTVFVSERSVTVGDFWWELSALRRLFEASDLTGNPVVLC